MALQFTFLFYTNRSLGLREHYFLTIMKTFLRKAALASAAVSVAIGTMAQSIELKKEYNGSLFGEGSCIHSTLMKDGTTHICAYEDYGDYSVDENGNYCSTNLLKSFSIINSDLETVKEFTSGPLFEEFEEVTVNYIAKTLKIDSVNIDSEDYKISSFYDALGLYYETERESKELVEARLAESIAAERLLETTYNGERIIYYRVEESEHFDWGYQYPREGWLYKDYNNVEYIRFYYSPDAMEETSRYVSARFNIYMRSYFEFVDENTSDISPVTVSQSLFNDDEKFEFLLPILEPTTTTRYDEYSYTAETKFGYKEKGIKVVSEDGTVLHKIIASSDDSYIYIFRISDKTYLRIESDEIASFYEIKKNGNNSSINKVRDVRGMNIRPTVAGRNENITITLNDGDKDTERELIVTGVNGQLVERRTIPAGENRLEINAGMLRSGMYNFTLQKKGTFLDNGKVIVK